MPGLISLGLIPFMEEAWRELGDCFEFRVANESIKVIVHPDDVELLLLRRRNKYLKGSAYDQLRRQTGQGLISSEGDLWRSERRLIQPSFTRDMITRFGDVMVAQTERMLDRWEQKIAPGEAFDVHIELMRLTLEVISEALFNLSFASEQGAITMKTIREALELISARVTAVIELPSWVPTPGNIKLERAIAGLDRVVAEVIEDRRRSGDTRGDLLDALLQGRDEHGAPLDAKQLRDEVVTMLLAGQETTAVSLGWTLWLLSEHPDIRARMVEEIDAAVGDRVPTVEDLPKLGYIKQIVQESMRVISPIWATARNCVEADTLGAGYAVEPGTRVMHLSWLTHRHPEFWPDPDRFDPSRFEPDAIASRHKFAYTPFSEGPRKCIGEHFSIVESMLVLTRMFQRFEVEAAPGFQPQMEFQLTTRPRHGLLMVRRPRSA